jgi:predicted amidohydrolase YtcJ
MMASICAAGSSAQWVFLNAELAGADKPGMTALAVANGKIVAVGQDRDMRRWIGPGTRVVQAQKRSLIPGLIDSHMHTIRAGLTEHTEVHWSGLRSLKEAPKSAEFFKRPMDRGGWWMDSGSI